VTETPTAGDADPLFLGMLGTTACWTLEVPADGPDPSDGAFMDLRALYGRLPDVQWNVAGRAVQLVDWARSHRFCGRCGTPTAQSPGERAMKCPQCGLQAFPRLAPAIITLVSRGDEVLLARGRLFPVPMYSCIAGFVEPGESLEQAVHREVREEVGVLIKNVRYVGSQPWPFPHSLMLGFYADWAEGDIVIDESEIVDAQWFTTDNLPMIPPGISIARTLIDGWLAEH
jgi:NAD+ diphosphatase